MKKIMSFLLAVLLYVMSCAAADGFAPVRFGYAPMIAADYIEWAAVYHVSDVDLEYRYLPDEEGESEAMLFVDDIGILYDKNTLDGVGVLLFYMDGSTRNLSMVDQWRRASALYCSLEYGDPHKDGLDLAGGMRNAEQFMDELNEAMKGDAPKDHPVLFFKGRYANYLVSYVNEDRQWVILAQ